MRIWLKQWKNNRVIADYDYKNEDEDTRTHKIFQALEEGCYAMDLGKPIWLENTINDFKRHSKARFYQDHFVEEIEFDYLEIEVLEED